MSVMPRKDLPKKFLDASVVPVEQALLRRAEELEQPVFSITQEKAEIKAWIAQEFRALAEELHHW